MFAASSAARRLRGTFADRMVGSPDIFGHEGREPEQSINFVTCHDGFTLNDLVSYNHKHNEANGEGNRDGANDNRSWNCGVEGPTDARDLEKLRNRQVKNFFAVTLLSIGMPMILMGDEMRRTQRGNNNAYCHDDETNWLDWTLLEIRRCASLRDAAQRAPAAAGHGARAAARKPDASAARRTKTGTASSRTSPTGATVAHYCSQRRLRREQLLVHFILNAYWQASNSSCPVGTGESWRRWIDTALDSPADIVTWQTAEPFTGPDYRVEARSVVVLFAAAPAPAAPAKEPSVDPA